MPNQSGGQPATCWPLRTQTDSKSPLFSKRIQDKAPPIVRRGLCFRLERAMGIEPTWLAWKARALPLSYARLLNALYLSVGTLSIIAVEGPRCQLCRISERIAKVSSFPRKRESMTRLAADSSQSAPVDSRFRGNDGGCENDGGCGTFAILSISSRYWWALLHCCPQWLSTAFLLMHRRHCQPRRRKPEGCRRCRACGTGGSGRIR